ncbi:hypothetical protein HK101_006707, partial [Irineochytrium annulatum]
HPPEIAPDASLGSSETPPQLSSYPPTSPQPPTTTAADNAASTSSSTLSSLSSHTVVVTTAAYDIQTLVLENSKLKQIVGATRAANRKLEAQVRMLNRKRDTLTESVRGLKKDVKSERDARFVVERCLADRLQKMELDLDFKENEILELRDKERELTDELERRMFDDNDSRRSITSPPLTPATVEQRPPIGASIEEDADEEEDEEDDDDDDDDNAAPQQHPAIEKEEADRLQQLLVSGVEAATLLSDLHLRAIAAGGSSPNSTTPSATPTAAATANATAAADEPPPLSVLRAFATALVGFLARPRAAGSAGDGEEEVRRAVARYGIVLGQWAEDGDGEREVLRSLEDACADVAGSEG